MARNDDKIRMPSTGAGITQYWDDVKTKVEMRPEYVIVLAVVIIVLELLLQVYGKSWFGLG